MRYVLFTSDKYVNLVAEQGRLWNKFTTRRFEVEVLGFAPPTVAYPDNYHFVSLGDQSDYPNKNWADPIRPIIEGIEENYFVLHWDDLFPIGSLNEELFDEAVDLVSSRAAQKCTFFFGARNQYLSSLRYNNNFVELKQDIDYRVGLTPGIWSKDYFLKYLNPGDTSWDYEIRGSQSARNDGATLLLPRKQPISPYINMYDKGVFHYKHLNQMKSSKTGRNYGWNKFQKLEDEEYEMFLKHEKIKLY